jgi:8-oxo-dGTP diphosphatase
VILIGVGAIIQDDKDRILLVKHKKERGGYWQGKWICPGGRLEYGEQIRDGIKREVKEETNLDIELITPLVPFDRIVTSNKETSLHVIYIDYIAKLLGGELKAASDVGEALWVEKKEIPKMWQELHEDTQRLLKIAGIG